MKIFLFYSVFFLILFTLAIWFLFPHFFHLSTLNMRGTEEIGGLRKNVEITFDERGIPHIWALNNEDMYLTLGWLHASERLFQMEMVRRLMSGTLSEVIGPAMYELDCQQRRLGFHRTALKEIESLRGKPLEYLQMYCLGINRWINQSMLLPPEFYALQISPRPWTPADCMGIFYYQTWFSHSLMDGEENYQVLQEELGEVLSSVYGKHLVWSPPTVHADSLNSWLDFDISQYQMATASNSWTIAPLKSLSGAALHCSDPHLAVNRMPGFWYIVGLSSSEGTHIVGITAPGIPIVVMGHNETTAWSFTVASVDIIDRYRFKRDPENPLIIIADSGPYEMESIAETVFIKGEGPRKCAILHTPRGVVIEENDKDVVSLHWAGFDFSPNGIISQGFALHQITGFEQFRRIVTDLGALDVNWLYSDRYGNIGYQLGTPIPRRNVSATYDILDGSDPNTAWSGYYDLDETPSEYNPSRGYIASCNNQIVDQNWPYPLPGFYDPYRITRAESLITAKTKVTREDMAKMQLDRISGIAVHWKSLFRESALSLGDDRLAKQIEDWNGSMDENSMVAAKFAVWWKMLAKGLFEDELKESWKLGRAIQEEVLTLNITELIDDKRTKDTIETARDIGRETLQNVVTSIGNGRFGNISSLLKKHPLGSIRFLDLWFDLNRGPYPAPGDRGSLNANYFSYNDEKQRFDQYVGPSMRFILDWSNINDFTIYTDSGQSGNPLSPHYDDCIGFMRTGREWKVPFTRGAVYENMKSLLLLKPQPPSKQNSYY